MRKYILLAPFLLLGCTGEKEQEQDINIEDVSLERINDNLPFDTSKITVVHIANHKEEKVEGSYFGRDDVVFIKQNNVNWYENSYIKDSTLYGLPADFEGYILLDMDGLVGVGKTEQELVELLHLTEDTLLVEPVPIENTGK